MPAKINVTLTDDELEMVIDALEADAENYRTAADEARKAGSSGDRKTFEEAAERIDALLVRLRDMVED